jgi:hypothetical protein
MEQLSILRVTIITPYTEYRKIQLDRALTIQ